MSKSCPFCKKRIEDEETCPHCHRVIIEKVSSHAQRLSDTYQKTEKHNTSATEINFVNPFKKIKGKYWAILLMVIFFFVVLNKNNVTTLQEDQKIPNTLANGTVKYSFPSYFRGLGELTIKNGTDSNAFIKLVNTAIDKKVIDVYISSKNQYTIKNISDGTYRVLFATGKDWDAVNERFLEDATQSEFEKALNFQTGEKQTFNSIETSYSVFELTLHAVVGGTAKTHSIPEAEFAKY